MKFFEMYSLELFKKMVSTKCKKGSMVENIKNYKNTKFKTRILNIKNYIQSASRNLNALNFLKISECHDGKDKTECKTYF